MQCVQRDVIFYSNSPKCYIRRLHSSYRFGGGGHYTRLMDIEAHRRTTGLMMTKGPPTLSLSFDLSSLPLNDLNAEARRRRRHTLLRRWNATISITHNSPKN